MSLSTIEKAEAEPPAFGFSARTSRGETALANLDARIEAGPDDAARVPLLLARARFSGSYDDFQTVDRITHAILEAEPEASASYRLRATYLSAVHLFDEASAALDRAEALGASPASTQRERIILAVATGRIDDALEAQARALVESHRSTDYLGTLATLLAARGRFEEADALYIEASESLRDVSPFPVAYSLFARGVMWAEMANQPKKAKPLYEEAVRRLPQYVVANVHLAEMESEGSERAKALERLAALVNGGDPEPAGLLAELLEEVDPSRAASLTEGAKVRYDVLLARHRLAFADHGAEFFMGPGDDAARALALAEENLALRPVPRAVCVAIDAAMAAGNEARACQLREAHEGLREVHPVLDDLAASLDETCAN